MLRPKSNPRRVPSIDRTISEDRVSARIAKRNSNMSLFRKDSDVFDTDSSSSSKGRLPCKIITPVKGVSISSDQEEVPTVGTKFDLLDNNGTFNVAIVKSVKCVKGETLLGCHYIGWEPCYDADCKRLKFPNSRIAPLHSITRVYKAFVCAGTENQSVTWPVQVYFRQPMQGYKGDDFTVFALVWVVPYGKPHFGLFNIKRDEGMWVHPGVILSWDIGKRGPAMSEATFNEAMALAKADIETPILPVSNPCDKGSSMLKEELLNSVYTWPLQKSTSIKKEKMMTASKIYSKKIVQNMSSKRRDQEKGVRHLSNELQNGEFNSTFL